MAPLDSACVWCAAAWRAKGSLATNARQEFANFSPAVSDKTRGNQQSYKVLGAKALRATAHRPIGQSSRFLSLKHANESVAAPSLTGMRNARRSSAFQAGATQSYFVLVTATQPSETTMTKTSSAEKASPMFARVQPPACNISMCSNPILFVEAACRPSRCTSFQVSDGCSSAGRETPARWKRRSLPNVTSAGAKPHDANAREGSNWSNQ